MLYKRDGYAERCPEPGGRLPVANLPLTTRLSPSDSESNSMKRLIALTSILALAGCAPAAIDRMEAPVTERPAAVSPAETTTAPAELALQADARAATWEDVIAEWPEESRDVARDAVEMYGQPQEMAETQLIWHNVGPWKRVVSYSEPVQHNFPMPHIDVLEGFIDYDINPDMVSELTNFTGSIYVDRTKGEMSARCDIEGANFLSINLGHQIMTGQRTAEEARQIYTETMMRMKQGEKPAMTQGFTFEVPRRDTADPDEPTVNPDEM
jgi:hypothetical protein